MEFQFKCHLSYEISGPASFLFNVAVAQNSFQRIITEHLEVAGEECCQEILTGGQPYHRLTAQRGAVELTYEAVVDATHELLGDRRVQLHQNNFCLIRTVWESLSGSDLTFSAKPLCVGQLLIVLRSWPYSKPTVTRRNEYGRIRWTWAKFHEEYGEKEKLDL